MKIMLLNSPPLKHFGIVGQIYPPLGILYIASYLRKNNSRYDIKALDGYREKSIDAVINRIVHFHPDILGVSSVTQAATGALEIITHIRNKIKGVVIIAGGPHPTLFPGELLLKAHADAVVMGEGEVTFSELVHCLYENKDYNELPGLAVKQSGKVNINAKRPLITNLDDIPFPARDLLDIKAYPGYHYKKTVWDTSFLSGRGCPYQCVYCSNPVWKYDKPWMRLRSPENISSELEELKAIYGVSEFYDQTDLFNGNLKWAKAVCDEYIQRKLDIHWKVQMTAKNIDKELGSKMVESGCWLGLIGVETGNDKTSRGINKRSTTALVEQSLSILKQSGMKTFALLMAFNVWEEDGRLHYENMADTMNTLRFVRRLIHKNLVDIISWSLTTPYPGSRLYDIAQKHNLIPGDMDGKWEFWDSSENFIMHLPGVRKKDWQKVKRKGKLLQIMLLFKSGTFNIRSLPIYIKKAWLLIKNKFLT
ncbi:MAG: B12-binding domain-containing radical SAM protein [Spirochaetales bacterium]|nr:B12-binding domain-containing radical SAM protein [Spirochaetales bacterium]